MEDKKAVPAIVAAVTAYLEEEQQSRLIVTPRRKPSLAFSLWQASGREEMMRMRTLWQLRIPAKSWRDW